MYVYCIYKLIYYTLHRQYSGKPRSCLLVYARCKVYGYGPSGDLLWIEIKIVDIDNTRYFYNFVPEHFLTPASNLITIFKHFCGNKYCIVYSFNNLVRLIDNESIIITLLQISLDCREKIMRWIKKWIWSFANISVLRPRVQTKLLVVSPQCSTVQTVH